MTIGRLEKSIPSGENEVDYFKKLLRRKPEKTLLLDFLGEAYYKIAEYHEAIHCWKKLIKVEQLDDENRIIIKIAQAYELLGELEYAYHYYYKALENSPDNLRLQNKYGEMAYNIENYQEAVILYQKIISRDSKNDIAWHNLGLAYYNLGFHEDAMECLSYSLELNEKSAETWYVLASIYAENYLITDALITLEKAIKLKPELKIRARSDEAFYSLMHYSLFDHFIEV